MAFVLVPLSVPVFAQTSGPPPAQEHQHHMPAGASAPTWTFMQDGIVFGMFNHQGGARGGDEFKVPNWWMGMLSRDVGKSKLTFTSMLSLDAATVGKRGYREIFQSGEAVDGQPLIDRQHPHDVFMQLSAVWRTPLTERTGLTLAGGPVGEPALGPVAFMHRASAAENPMAPLGHHVFDSTHIAFGVVTAAVDYGPFVVEGSIFNGREPDENRWNFDFGALDSVSGRVWFKPNDKWEFQVSSGHLVDPEELEPGNVIRTTASGSWFSKSDADFTAVTVGWGINAAHGTTRQAVVGEVTRRQGANAIFSRVEGRQLETAVLLTGRVSSCPSVVHCIGIDEQRSDAVAAVTFGGTRDLIAWRGFEGAVGAQATVYGVPDVLKSTHGSHPVSFQLFFRVRTPAPMGRMWNMRMSQPTAGHDMAGTSGMK